MSKPSKLEIVVSVNSTIAILLFICYGIHIDCPNTAGFVACPFLGDK